MEFKQSQLKLTRDLNTICTESFVVVIVAVFEDILGALFEQVPLCDGDSTGALLECVSLGDHSPPMRF